MPRELYKEFERLNLGFIAHTEGITIEVEPTLDQDIRKGQLEDSKIQEIKEMIEAGKAPDFTEDEHGTVWFRKRICVPDVDHLREKILQEAHDSAYSIHPGSTKMYQDLKERYWWYGMKRDVAAHVALCDVCQRVKAEHQRPAGLLQPWKVRYGFHCGVATNTRWLRFYMGHSGPTDQGGSLYTGKDYIYRCTIGRVVHLANCVLAWGT
jgi:hypothetical protein